MSMRVLLIGGNGFIGRYLVAALKSQGHTISLFHRGNAPAPEGVQEILGDRNQLAACTEQLRRFAADIVVDLVLSSERQARELLEVFRDSVRRLVVISSMDVYRAVGVLHGTEPGPLQQLPLTEDSALRRNLHPYPPEGVQRMRQIFNWVTDDYDKIPVERIVMGHPDMPCTVLRLPLVYGPGDPLHRFYPVVKRVNDRRRHIIFPRPLAEWRASRGYVENVTTAIVLAVTDERAAGRIYNVCEERALSELEWSRKIASEMQWQGEFVVLPPERTPAHLLQAGNAAQHWVASSARIRNELGYREAVSIEEGIRRTIRWEQENPPEKFIGPPIDYMAEDRAVEHRSG